MYTQKSRLTPHQQSRLIDHFVAGTPARASSELIGVQAHTAIRFFMGLRQLIASKLPSYELSREVEADESYFGGKRKGKRGRRSAGKVAVFVLLKRGGKVYTAIIPNAKTETLYPLLSRMCSQIVLYIPIPFAPTMLWISPSFTICELTTVNSLQIKQTTLME